MVNVKNNILIDNKIFEPRFGCLSCAGKFGAGKNESKRRSIEVVSVMTRNCFYKFENTFDAQAVGKALSRPFDLGCFEEASRMWRSNRFALCIVSLSVMSFGV